MAKDGTNRGGPRIGSGQKKKPLHDKILEGNPGRRPLQIVEFQNTDSAELMGQPMPPPHDFLSSQQKDGRQTLALQVYEQTWRWLEERKCTHLVPGQLLELYAQSVARWIQCEEAVDEFGMLAKHPTTGNAMPSPYVAIGQSYLKQVNNLWYQIFQTVKENNAADYTGSSPHDDAMEQLLSRRRKD